MWFLVWIWVCDFMIIGMWFSMVVVVVSYGCDVVERDTEEDRHCYGEERDSE